MLLSTAISVAAALLIAEGLARLPPFRGCLADIGGRTPQIDGLRGLCALLVAAHHLVYYLGYQANGIWKIARADHALETMGKASVAYFFLICAYLFWGKLFRPGIVIDVPFVANFVRGRLRRLVPLYIVAMIFSLVVIGFIGQGCRLAQGPADTLDQIVRSMSFSFLGPAAFNGSFLTYAATSVSWSLEYEWVFYAILPALAALGLNRWWFVSLPTLLVANAVWFHFSYFDYFAYGALTYELTRSDVATRLNSIQRLLSGRLGDVVSLGIAAFVLHAATGIEIGHAPTSFLIFLSFLPIAWGADWFGLLRCNASRLIGAISYSVYLLNIPLLYVMGSLWLSGTARGGALIATEASTLVAIVVCCTFTYRSIERSFIVGGDAARLVVFRERPAKAAALG